MSTPVTVRIRLPQPFAPLAAVLADRSGMVMSCHLVCGVYGRRVVELRDLNP